MKKLIWICAMLIVVTFACMQVACVEVTLNPEEQMPANSGDVNGTTNSEEPTGGVLVEGDEACQHVFGDWVVSDVSTYEDGRMVVRNCTLCGCQESRIVDWLGVEVAQNASNVLVSNDGDRWTTSIDLCTEEERNHGLDHDAILPSVPTGPISVRDGKKNSDDLYDLLRSEMYSAYVHFEYENELLVLDAPIAVSALERDFWVRSSDAVDLVVTINAKLLREGGQRADNGMLCVMVFDETGAVWTAKVDPQSASHTGNVKLVACACNRNDVAGFCAPASVWSAGDIASVIDGQTCSFADLDVLTLHLDGAESHHLRLIAWLDAAGTDNAGSGAMFDVKVLLGGTVG